MLSVRLLVALNLHLWKSQSNDIWLLILSLLQFIILWTTMELDIIELSIH